MVKHSILLSSSYSRGERICLHYADPSDAEFKAAVDKVRGAYGGKTVPFSTHVVLTDSDSWESVVEKDPYFDDVEPIGSAEEFVECLQEDRYLKGIDAARYILSITPCTHTRLEKLTYMCYADYLCKTGDRLFTDSIYAFAHGPAVETVYETYSDESSSRPGEPLPVSEEICADVAEAPMKSRILFSEDGQKKLESISATLRRYGGISTESLTELTHRNDTPWSATPRTDYYAKITDPDIIRYHRNESLGRILGSPAILYRTSSRRVIRVRRRLRARPPVGITANGMRQEAPCRTEGF